jgi:3-deoxy-7-phosphoheptulonate synthase / chorismate mutase
MKRFETELGALRDRVDAIDTQLLALLNARAAVVRDIYMLKDRQGVPRFNQARTEAILQRLIDENQGPLEAQEVRELFVPILEFFVQRYRADTSATTDSDNLSR